MKLLNQLPFTLLILAAFTACGPDDASADGMGLNEITPLTESQVSNFVYVLPEVLDFSEGYFARATPEEKDSPDANRKYLEALKKSSRIRESVRTHGYLSVDEFMLVYKNIVLEYTTLKRELTNDTAIAAVSNKIHELKSAAAMKLDKPGIAPEEEKRLKDEISGLENDETRFRNILLVKKYETALDQATRNAEN